MAGLDPIARAIRAVDAAAEQAAFRREFAFRFRIARARFLTSAFMRVYRVRQ